MESPYRLLETQIPPVATCFQRVPAFTEVQTSLSSHTVTRYLFVQNGSNPLQWPRDRERPRSHACRCDLGERNGNAPSDAIEARNLREDNRKSSIRIAITLKLDPKKGRTALVQARYL